MSSRGNQPINQSSNHNASREMNQSKRPPKKNKHLNVKGKKAPRKRVDKQQNSLINKLSKQVYSLQMSKWGKIQQNFQTVLEPFYVTEGQPAVFDLTDVSCKRTNSVGALTHNGCRIYRAPAVGSETEILPNIWSIDSTYINNNFYWAEQNKDGPDTGGYFLDSVTYFIKVTGRQSLDDTRIRFDVVSQKPGTLDGRTVPTGPGGSSSALVLPWTITSFKGLVGARNRINPIYFKKYFSKVVYINSTPAPDSGLHPTTGNTQMFSFKLKPKKAVFQKKTDPLYMPGQLPASGALDSPYGPDNIGSYLTPLHLIISTDDPVANNGDQVSITMSRRVVFRDMMGSAQIVSQ